MNYVDIDNFIGEGENTYLEFKRKVSSPEKIARTISAFANTKGGYILFGVDDDGTIIGVRSEKEEIELIRFAGNHLIQPPIEVKIEIIPYKAKKDVVVCYVEQSELKPHRYIGEDKETLTTCVFIRVNDSTIEASKEVVKVLQNQNSTSSPLRISIGENEKRLLHFLEMNNRITKNQFCEFANIGNRRASRILVNLVRSGIVQIHTHEKEEFYTISA